MLLILEPKMATRRHITKGLRPAKNPTRRNPLCSTRPPTRKCPNLRGTRSKTPGFQFGAAGVNRGGLLPRRNPPFQEEPGAAEEPYSPLGWVTPCRDSCWVASAPPDLAWATLALAPRGSEASSRFPLGRNSSLFGARRGIGFFWAGGPRGWVLAGAGCSSVGLLLGRARFSL